MDYREKKTECSKNCGRPRRTGQRTCRECHAQEMRVVRFRTKMRVPAIARRGGVTNRKKTAPVPLGKMTGLRLCGGCLTNGLRVVASQTHSLMAVCSWCVMGQRPPAEAQLTDGQWEQMTRERAKKKARETVTA